eukprot:TRINITY_DN22132_c1_g1_i1.p1 TRINITY_DN22132_c1_g1~~TRINITY_DN22132_c1_g1_i1.p1  ORF type:complete len:388 (+),score=49.46 TRINITY_DN22132_c1_g1_i1:43-1164(+)
MGDPRRQTFNFTVNGLAGKLCEVRLGGLSSLADLKQQISETIDVPVERQRLLINDEILRGADDVPFALTLPLIMKTSCLPPSVTVLLVKRTDEQLDILSTISRLTDSQVYSYLEHLNAIKQHVLDDVDIIWEATHRCPEAMQFASTRLKCDRQFQFASISYSGYNLEHACGQLLADKEFVMQAVRRSHRVLKTAVLFQADFGVVTHGLGLALQFASPEMRSDKATVCKCVQTCAGALLYASETMRSDRAVVLLAVRKNGSALRYASDSLRADREIVFVAVQSNREALRYVAEPLKSYSAITQLIRREQDEWEDRERHERFFDEDEIALDISAPRPPEFLGRRHGLEICWRPAKRLKTKTSQENAYAREDQAQP